MFYSVGPDGRDDGGVCNRKEITAPGTDIVFRLWDPAQRRQPARELLPKPTEVQGCEEPGIPSGMPMSP